MRLDDRKAVGLYSKRIVLENSAEAPDIIESEQNLADIFKLYAVSASVDEENIVGFIACPGKADKTAVVVLDLVDDEICASVFKVWDLLSYAAKLGDILDKLLILISPWVAAAVERILIALQACLVAVVDARNAGKEIHKSHCDFKEIFSVKILLGSEPSLGHPVLALVVAVFTAEAVYGTLDIVGRNEIHKNVDSRLRVVLDYGHDRENEVPWTASLDEIDDSLAERIIHD